MGKVNIRKADGNRYRKNRLWLRAQGRPCWICEAFGRPAEIDYSLPGGHPASFELDHLIPISKGGDPYARDNCAATHRACNEWRGNKSVAEVMRIARGGPRPTEQAVADTTSREW